MSWLAFSFLSLFGFGVLVYSYQNQKAGKRILVPSLFILKQLTYKKRRSKKLYLPPRFILELLSVLFLSLYFIQHYFLPSEDTHLLVLDTSLSMAAKKTQLPGAKDLDAETRLDAAKKEARRYIESHEGRFTILTTDSKKPLTQVEDVDQSYSSRSIAQTIEAFFETKTEKAQYSKLAVFTDKRVVLTSPHQVFRSWRLASNAFFASEPRQLEDAVELEIGFSGSGSSSARVLVSQWNNGAWQKRKHKNVQISNGSISKVSIRLSQSLKESTTALRFVLDSFLHEDALSEDNTAYFVARPSKLKSKYLFVTQTITPQIERELSSLFRVTGDATIVTYDEYQDVKNEFTRFLFYKSPLPPFFDGPSIVILPSESSEYLTLREFNANERIISWSKRSALTKYVTFSLFPPSAGVTFEEVAFANTVVLGENGPVLLSGIHQGKPVVISGINLLPLRNKKPQPSDILLVNILRKLEEDVTHNGVHGQKKAIRTCVYTEQGCQELGDIEVPELYPPGLYDSEDNTLIAANISDPIESYTAIERVEKIENALKQAGKDNSIGISSEVHRSQNTSLIFIYCALFLMGLDLLILCLFKSELGWSQFKRGGGAHE